MQYETEYRKKLKEKGYTDKDLKGKFGLIADVMKICREYLTDDKV